MEYNQREQPATLDLISELIHFLCVYVPVGIGEGKTKSNCHLFAQDFWNEICKVPIFHELVLLNL